MIKAEIIYRKNRKQLKKDYLAGDISKEDYELRLSKEDIARAQCLA